MKRIAATLMGIACLSMAGCGGNIYYKNRDASRNITQDESYCKSVAIGSVPMPNMQQYQNNAYPYTPRSGTMSDQYGNVYRYKENYNFMESAQSNMAMAQQGFNNMGIGLQNLANQLEVEEARSTIFNQCMTRLGWTQISKEEHDTIQQRRENPHLAIIQAAEQGNAQAQLRLAQMYYKGEKVQQDPAQAVKWTQKSADQGHPIAQYIFGMMYINGYGGLLAKDHRKAVEWIRKAAEQGHPIAQDILGDVYFHGDDGIGIAKDRKRAMEWYSKAIPGLRQAAEQGITEAQFRLFGGLFHGLGVPKDEAEAVMWLKKAAERGYQPAQDTLNKMKQDGKL